MNSSLDKLVKNLSDEDFKYLVEKFGSENFRVTKTKTCLSLRLYELVEKYCV